MLRGCRHLQPADANELDYPHEVADDELIVRVVKSPFHLNAKRTRLTPAAFQPPKDSERGDVSVIRWPYTFSEGVVLKAKVREIGGEAYAGVAHLPCRKVREAPADIEDSRKWYQGHADIIIGVAILLQEPTEGDDGVRIRAIKKALSDASTFLHDPQPLADEWTINELPPPEPWVKDA
jgi:hypothetical protein